LPGAETAPGQPEPPEPEPESEPEPDRIPVITITLNDKSEYPIYPEDVEEWQELFPAVDVMQQLRNMKSWAKDNPTKRKTSRGIRRFINSWLTREQDKYHGPAQPQPQRGSAQSGNVFMEMLNERRGGHDL
jgi:hypothetical protein